MQDSNSLDWVIAAMNPVSMERDQVRPVVIITHQKNWRNNWYSPISDEDYGCPLHTRILAVACLWVENYSGKLSTLLLLQYLEMTVTSCKQLLFAWHEPHSVNIARWALDCPHTSSLYTEHLSVSLWIPTEILCIIQCHSGQTRAHLVESFTKLKTEIFSAHIHGEWIHR